MRSSQHGALILPSLPALVTLLLLFPLALPCHLLLGSSVCSDLSLISGRSPLGLAPHNLAARCGALRCDAMSQVDEVRDDRSREGN